MPVYATEKGVVAVNPNAVKYTSFDIEYWDGEVVLTVRIYFSSEEVFGLQARTKVDYTPYMELLREKLIEVLSEEDESEVIDIGSILERVVKE